MAGRLLFVILMSLLPPKLVVNSPVITETSSIATHSQKPVLSLSHHPGELVIFACSLPGSADNDTRCNLYFGEESRPVVTTTIWGKSNSKTNQKFCPFTVTIDDLRRYLHSVQQSYSTCDYSLGGEPNSLSPRSDGYRLNDIVESESFMPPTKSTATDLPGASTVVTPVKPASDIVEIESHMTQTKPTFTMTTVNLETASHTTQTMSTFTMTTGTTLYTGLTVSKYHASTPTTPSKQTSGLTVRPSITGSFISTSLTPVKPTPGQTLYKPSFTSQNPSSVSEIATESGATAGPSSSPDNVIEDMRQETFLWKLIAVAAGFGVTVGVILMGLALLCTKRRTERCSYKRTQASDTDDFVCLRNLDHGGLLPGGNDEVYSVITSVPGADCSPGSEKLSRQQSQNEDSDIYHVYATISEEPPASALNVMVYSTLQAH
ncbi:uncharacterized protein LOC119886590 isoform X2 [Micropterus salmoides]|uniref:uncharacterized protein LOC119886590 isoform X2 n=1 Tax=Micropterus salmoides TaxID=27706 RepID=UPI0018EC9FFB|nr:uncharacterized protein LOC119886590 isoform X2 [Micropterus salmoides]